VPGIEQRFGEQIEDAERSIAELLPRVQEIADQLNPSEIANLLASRPP
jgi:hypothetical protein